MAHAVWRFESYIENVGDADPMVMVYVGETYVNEETQERVLHRDPMVWTQMPLSQVPAFIANPVLPEDAKKTLPGVAPASQLFKIPS